MTPFWKCVIVSKTLVRRKLKFYPFGVNWGPLFIFGPITPKSKIPRKFNSLNLLMVTLNFLMVNETILKMPFKLYQLNFGKNKLEILPFWRALELISIIGPTGPKLKKDHKLRHCGLLGVLNTLLAISYPEGKYYD